MYTPQGPMLLGSAEVWVPGSGEVCAYAAPDLVIHYISVHRYLPPDVFLQAVMRADAGAWDGCREADRIVMEAFSARNPTT